MQPQRRIPYSIKQDVSKESKEIRLPREHFKQYNSITRGVDEENTIVF